jgi:thioredoxin-related protein
MRNILTIICCCISIITTAQEKEINFVAAKNWQDVLRKARAENKNIFIDAFATWCVPCKQMDAEVYTDASVSDYANKEFLSIKIQFDQTKNDSEYIKNWHQDAKEIQKKYNIGAFPTFLFFNSSGELINRSQGFHSPSQFLVLLKESVNPELNYAGMIIKFKNGIIKNEQLLELALKAKKFKQDTLALAIAKRYKEKVLDKSNPESILNERLKAFMYAFNDMISVESPIFKYMISNVEATDLAVKDKGFSQRTKEYYVSHDIIYSQIRPNGKYQNQVPNWRRLEDEITKSYGSATAKKLLREAKINWYTDKSDWVNAVKYNIEKVEASGIDTAGMGASMINNMVFDIIFKHSSDPIALNKALTYMDVILKFNPESPTWRDTRANVLYKLGRKEEAIKESEYALQLITRKARSRDEIKEYEDTLQKMRSGLPTWDVVH